MESREGREHRHGIGLYSQSRIHDSTRRPITLADDNLRGPEDCRTMRVLDARNHRQGDGDQGPRLTALPRRCVQDADPRRTSLLSRMSAAERGADQHGKGAAYLIKPLFCTPRRGARVVVSNAGRMPLSCAAALRRARRTLHKARAGICGLSMDRDPSFHASQGRRGISDLGLPRPCGRAARSRGRLRPLVIAPRHARPFRGTKSGHAARTSLQ